MRMLAAFLGTLRVSADEAQAEAEPERKRVR